MLTLRINQNHYPMITAPVEYMPVHCWLHKWSDYCPLRRAFFRLHVAED